MCRGLSEDLAVGTYRHPSAPTDTVYQDNKCIHASSSAASVRHAVLTLTLSSSNPNQALNLTLTPCLRRRRLRASKPTSTSQASQSPQASPAVQASAHAVTERGTRGYHRASKYGRRPCWPVTSAGNDIIP